jgi:uncharacterized membrane protein YqjE
VVEEVNKKPPEERSVGELVSELTDEVKRLVRDEIQLARFELRHKGRRMGTGAGLLGMAGLFALFGTATLIAAAVLALALVMPAWLSALLIGGVLLLVAGLAALVGRKEVTQAGPVLKEVIEGIRQDVVTVKQGVHS